MGLGAVAAIVETSPIWLALAALAGVALGIFHYGGLWLTVKKVASSSNPQALMFGSFAVRVAVVVIAVVLLARTHWELAVAALVGLVIGRTVLVRVLGPLTGRPGGGERTDDDAAH